MMQEKFSILHETLLSQNKEAGYVPTLNEEAYKLLQSDFVKENLSTTAQPNLIVGEAGSGKTVILKRLFNLINSRMSSFLYPILIEGKSLFSTKEIWRQCALTLNLEQGGEFFEQILGWQEHQAKRIVLLIDNIQYYFERTDNMEHYGLRGKLNRAGAPIITATSNKVLPAFTEYDAAFFDGFKITYLKPLTDKVIQELVNNKYDISRIKKLILHMPKTIRSLIIAKGIISKSKDSEEDSALLLDYLYSYYQVKFDLLLTQTQRILCAMAHSYAALSLPEIRRITGQENGKISPYLKLMMDKKIINKEAKTLRGGTYSISDPLFKLWLQRFIKPLKIQENIK